MSLIFFLKHYNLIFEKRRNEKNNHVYVYAYYKLKNNFLGIAHIVR